MASRILVPHCAPAMESQCINYWTSREVPGCEVLVALLSRRISPVFLFHLTASFVNFSVNDFCGIFPRVLYTNKLFLLTSLCIFNFYAEYLMRNAGLEETEAEIKIAGRNINNLRYADDTTLMAESEEELKSLLMKVKEESRKVGFKAQLSEN